jgi:endonuclease-3
MTEGGTYVLVFALSEPVTVEVGALGQQRFPAGGYCYVGSALGSGGFSRIDRHRRVADGEHDVRHWHVDYFGGHPASELADVVRVVGRDCECALADELGDGPARGFGASDCGCETHLARFSDAAEAVAAAVAAADRHRADDS